MTFNNNTSLHSAFLRAMFQWFLATLEQPTKQKVLPPSARPN